LGLHDDALRQRRVAAAPLDRPVERDVASLGKLRLPAPRQVAARIGPRLLRVVAVPLLRQLACEPRAQLVAEATLALGQVEVHVTLATTRGRAAKGRAVARLAGGCAIRCAATL